MKRYSPKYKRWYNDQYYWSKHEYRPSTHRGGRNRKRHSDPFSIIKRRLQWIKRIENRDAQVSGDQLCASGYTKSQGYTALCNAWTGFMARKKEGDEEGMHTYAMAIRKIEQDLGLTLYEFEDLKLAAVEYMNEPENSELLEEKAASLGKEADELSSQDILNVMLEQDQKAYEMLS